VSISSLRRFRQALADFVTLLPSWLEREGSGRSDLRAVEGGLA
jgi:succinyl-diaminopimelate desuccinylase